MANQAGWNIKLFYKDTDSGFQGFEEKETYLVFVKDKRTFYLKQFNDIFATIERRIFQLFENYNNIVICVEDLMSKQTIFKSSIECKKGYNYSIRAEDKKEMNCTSDELKNAIFEMLEVIKKRVRKYYQM